MTTMVSKGQPGPSRAPSVSADGRFVAYTAQVEKSGGEPQMEVFLYDSLAASTICLSRGLGGRRANGNSYNPVISDDGRRVAFVSSASNLVAGDINRFDDIFCYDRDSSQSLISVSGNSANGHSLNPCISGDGQVVAFESVANNLVADDNNDCKDIFRRDLRTSRVTRVNLGPEGREANAEASYPSIDQDGNLIVFESMATNLTATPLQQNFDSQVYVARSADQSVSLLSQRNGTFGNAPSFHPQISGDGKTVAFESMATNLTLDNNGGLGDILLADLPAGKIRLGSADGGDAFPRACRNASLSRDGKVLSFESYTGSPQSNIFVIDQRTQGIVVPTASAKGDSHNARLSADGKTLSWMSVADNLADDDTNGTWDVFATTVQ